MDNLTLGIDVKDLSWSAPECFDCHLSECNPQNKLCAAKGKKPAAAVKAASKLDVSRGGRRSSSAISMDTARVNIAWIAQHAHVWIGKNGYKMVEIFSHDEASLRLHGVTGNLRKSGRRFRLQTMNAELHDLVVGEHAKMEPQGQTRTNTIQVKTDSVIAKPVQVAAPPAVVDSTVTVPTKPLAYPEKIQLAKKLSTDAILLTIGVILDGDERDLVWALWDIQRELERRRG